jgi:hypothetical protein
MNLRRDALSAREKNRSFRAAFDVIAAHRQNGGSLAAYVIAFSIFEDRLTAAVKSAAELRGIAQPAGHLTLHKKINRLVAANYLDEESASDFKDAGDERNVLIHAAMWQLDVITDEHVAAAISRARRIDRIAARLRRELSRPTRVP